MPARGNVVIFPGISAARGNVVRILDCARGNVVTILDCARENVIRILDYCARGNVIRILDYCARGNVVRILDCARAEVLKCILFLNSLFGWKKVLTRNNEYYLCYARRHQSVMNQSINIKQQRLFLAQLKSACVMVIHEQLRKLCIDYVCEREGSAVAINHAALIFKLHSTSIKNWFRQINRTNDFVPQRSRIRKGSAMPPNHVELLRKILEVCPDLLYVEQ